MAEKKEGGVDWTNFGGIKGLFFSRKFGAIILGGIALALSGAPIAEVWDYLQNSGYILAGLIAGEDVAGKLGVKWGKG